MPSNPLKFAVVAAALNADIRRVPQAARTMGFSGLQLDAIQQDLDVGNLSDSARRELRHLFTSQSQQLVGIRADLGARGFGPGADVDRLLQRLDRLMESAAAFEAPLICLDIGRLPTAPRMEAPKPAIHPAVAGAIIIPDMNPPASAVPAATAPPAEPALEAQVSEALVELGRRADRFSVVFAFRSALASLADLASALRKVNCPWFGVDFDPAALLHDDWDADRAFSAFGPDIRHVRGRDAVRGADRRTRPAIIGQGDTDWPQLLADLDAAGYHGWLTIDPLELSDRPGAASAGLAALKKIMPV
jgi:sugar phosphate isomerase/epimerase